MILLHSFLADRTVTQYDRLLGLHTSTHIIYNAQHSQAKLESEARNLTS